METASAGLAPDADVPVDPEMLAWADLIFVMEAAHKARLQRRFGPHLKRARVIVLGIPDVPDKRFVLSGMTRFLDLRPAEHRLSSRPRRSREPGRDRAHSRRFRTARQG